MSTDTIQVKGSKQKSESDPGPWWKPPIASTPGRCSAAHLQRLFTLWLAAVMATLESLLGQPALRRRSFAGLAADRLALAHPLVCQLRRDPGRGARQGAGRQSEGRHEPAQRHVGSPARRMTKGVGTGHQPAQGDLVLVRSGEMIPADGEVVAASPRSTRLPSPANRPRHPRVRHRPQRRDRQHHCRFRPDLGAHHQQPGRKHLDRMIALVEGAKRRRPPTRWRWTPCWWG